MPNVNQISFGGMSSADLQSQQLKLQRQQQLADALRQQALTPIQQQEVSGRVVKTSPFEAISKVLTAYLSTKAQSGLDEKQAALGEAGRKRAADALRSMAPPEAGLSNQAPQVPIDAPPDTTAGFTPPQAPQVDPETRSRWARILSANEANPALGQKLLEQEMTAPKWSTSPHYDQQGKAFILSDKGGKPQYLDGVTARDKMENVNGVWQNPYQKGEGTFAPQDPNQPFGMGPAGVVPNAPYQQYQMAKAKAGATNVTTKTELKAAESIAGQVGPILKESAVAAQGAVQQMDAAKHVVQAVDSNKLYAGPGAGARLKVAQIGDLLGVTGADTAEKIANTRQAIRGLAEMTRQGRKQMSGQGAITESESKLAERATSGSIDEMTPAELKQLANASSRASQYIINEHNRKVQIAKSKPETAGIAGYFEASPMQAPAGIDDLVSKYLTPPGGK